MTDQDREAFEDALADYPRDMHLDGVYAVAEYFWLAALAHAQTAYDPPKLGRLNGARHP